MTNTLEAAKSCYLQSLVPTTRIPMAEVLDDGVLREALVDVAESKLPGFIVRASAQVTGAKTHYTFCKSILRNLQSAGYVFHEGYSLNMFTRASDALTGQRLGLHVDAGPQHEESSRYAITSEVRTLDVHTTIEGGGSVLIAESGTDAIRQLTKVGEAEPETSGSGPLAKILDHYLHEGQTDPTIILPTLHVAEVKEGDHVFFPLCNAAGPVWHSFETASDLRRVRVTLLDKAPLPTSAEI